MVIGYRPMSVFFTVCKIKDRPELNYRPFWQDVFDRQSIGFSRGNIPCIAESSLRSSSIGSDVGHPYRSQEYRNPVSSLNVAGYPLISSL